MLPKGTSSHLDILPLLCYNAGRGKIKDNIIKTNKRQTNKRKEKLWH